MRCPGRCKSITMDTIVRLFGCVSILTLQNVGQVYGMSHQLLEILKYMENDYEMVVISNRESQFAGRDQTTFDEVLQNFTIAVSSGIKTTEREYDADALDALAEQSDPQVTKVIADMETVDQTLQFFAAIGDPKQGFQNETANYWFLILWPNNQTNLVTIEDKQAELYFHLNKSTLAKRFPASSQVYVGFLRDGIDFQNASHVRHLFDFFEVYGLGGNLIVRQVYELADTFLDCYICPSQTIRRSNLYGVHLRVEGVEDPEFQNDTVYEDDGQGGIRLTDGFSVHILHMLQEVLNFTYSASIMTSVGAHGLGEVSAWDGVVRRVQNGEVDLGFSLTVQTATRWKRIAYLPPTDDYVISAFFRPSAAGIRDIFLHPFKIDLWAAVFSTWMVLAFSMILFSAILKKVGAVDPDSNEPDFTETSLIWALATVCQQGWDDHPSSTSMRIIFIAASFAGVVAYAGYSAAIVSTLSSKNDPIQTPEALINSHLTIGMRGGFLDIILQNNETEDVITKTYRRVSTNPSLARSNTSTGLESIEKRDYAFISVRDIFYDTVTQFRGDKDICGIRDLRLLTHGFPAGSFVAKSSPYKEFFRTMLIRIRERGAMWRLRTMYTYSRRCLITQENHQGQALGANDVFTAFMILVGGYGLSLVNLTVEKIVYVTRLNYVR